MSFQLGQGTQPSLAVNHRKVPGTQPGGWVKAEERPSGHSACPSVPPDGHIDHPKAQAELALVNAAHKQWPAVREPLHVKLPASLHAFTFSRPCLR